MVNNKGQVQNRARSHQVDCLMWLMKTIYWRISTKNSMNARTTWEFGCTTEVNTLKTSLGSLWIWRNWLFDKKPVLMTSPIDKHFWLLNCSRYTVPEYRGICMPDGLCWTAVRIRKIQGDAMLRFSRPSCREWKTMYSTWVHDCIGSNYWLIERSVSIQSLRLRLIRLMKLLTFKVKRRADLT